MDPSLALLNRYLADQSETAFRELVQRHVNLVYGTAWRRCGGDEALARDVSQAVFTDLARKASGLPRDVVLAGWLHRHTGFVAARMIRSEQRRRQREHTAFMENQLNPQTAAAESGALWQRMAPVLDDALSRLSSADRNALVLRFLEGREFREVGGALGLSENTARMRVTRALEKLRRVLARRGITGTGVGLGAALGLAVGTQVPLGLKTWLSATALQAAPAATGWATVTSLLAGWGKAVATVAAVALVSVPVGMLMASSGSGSGTPRAIAAGEGQRQPSAGMPPQDQIVREADAGDLSGTDDQEVTQPEAGVAQSTTIAETPAEADRAPAPAAGDYFDGSPVIMTPAPVTKLKLGVIPLQIQFDPKILTVSAGATVQLLFTNARDPLQHNWLLLKPGTLNAVGALADKMAADPAAAAKFFIPTSSDILVSGNKLVGIGQNDLITFTAPATPGDYPFVCTFLGHWRTMNGILTVTP